MLCMFVVFFFYCSVNTRDLHVLTHSFPTRRSSDLPLALGAGSVTPLQLAGGFAVFANGGYRIPPYLIDHVTDSSGKIIMQAKPIIAGDAAARAIHPRPGYVLDDMLRGVATTGTSAPRHHQPTPVKYEKKIGG